MAANPSAKNGQQASPDLPPPPKLLDQVRTTIRNVALLGHADVSTTMIYTHVLNRGGLAVNSPLDRL